MIIILYDYNIPFYYKDTCDRLCIYSVKRNTIIIFLNKLRNQIYNKLASL